MLAFTKHRVAIEKYKRKLKICCLFGVKRSNVTHKLKKKNVMFGEDNRANDWVEKIKTDQKRVFLNKDFSVSDILLT